MLRLIGFVSLLFALSSCKKSEPYSISGIEGKTLEEIIHKYGKPEYEYLFPLTDTVLEHRYGLLELFKERGDFNNIMIKEIKFHNRKEETYIWFYREDEISTWKVVGSLVVPDDVKI